MKSCRRGMCLASSMGRPNVYLWLVVQTRDAMDLVKVSDVLCLTVLRTTNGDTASIGLVVTLVAMVQ